MFYDDFDVCTTSASLSPVRCNTHFVHDEALENSIFGKLL